MFLFINISLTIFSQKLKFDKVVKPCAKKEGKHI